MRSTSSSETSFSVFALVQYTFLALVAYVLVGAPLREILDSGSGQEEAGSEREAVGAQKLESLVVPDANLTCEERGFRGTHVVSREPLVVYVEGFLGVGEADEVVELRYVCFSFVVSLV